ncbi:MAG TPA: cytochrome c [Microvirga sp.]|nr:cytochrome c [Microvirga sp.]
MRLALIALVLAPVLGGCDSGTKESRDVSSTRVVMRDHVPVPPETVPRGAGALAAGLAPPGPAVTPALLARGREQFAAFCSPCHGTSGRGDGTVVGRGFPRPPSYHEERLRGAPAAHFVAIITNGIGAMYPYAERVPPEDRWAIAHYVKALQAEENRPPPERAAP